MKFTKLLLGLALLLTVAAGSVLHAQEMQPPQGAVIAVERNEGTLIRLNAPVTSVFVANPEVADVMVKSPRLIYLLGRRPGETTLYAVDDAENVILDSTVQVTHNLSKLVSEMQRLVPDGDVQVQSIDGGLVLAGAVATAAESEDARRLAQRFIGEGEEVINRLEVTAANQVNLRVRVAEVQRSILKQLGINWNVAAEYAGFTFGLVTSGFGASDALLGTAVQQSHTFPVGYNSSNLDANALIDALSDEGLVSLLAEPNLTALSGETASFLAGGEFPIPVAQDTDTITVEFKKFGVSLAFTPTLIGGRRISLRVAPEVSATSNENAVVVGSFVVPSLTTRRAETTVELASGQSFAIAGLIQDRSQIDGDKVPGLGDIPVLGELFHSDKFSRKETELVIVVTPYIVQPVGSQRMAVPTDMLSGQEGSQRVVSSAPMAATTTVPPQNAPVIGQSNPAGFVLE
jgi:pilus assembly protein CpaC